MKNPARRKLKEGEFCNVETKYTADKNYKFFGNKIESSDDIAYIFKQLEKSSVENCFVVHVKDKKPVVQHLSMGGLSGTVIDINQITDAVQRFKPDQLYFIHNHPSGNIYASAADRSMFKNIRDTFGDIVQPGIIINTNQGKYGIFDVTAENDEQVIKKQNKEIGHRLPVIKFDRQIFKQSVYQPKITSSGDVAKLVSQIRFFTKG